LAWIDRPPLPDQFWEGQGFITWAEYETASLTAIGGIDILGVDTDIINSPEKHTLFHGGRVKQATPARHVRC
jgi:hypothetical protein